MGCTRYGGEKGTMCEVNQRRVGSRVASRGLVGWLVGWLLGWLLGWLVEG